MSPPPREPIKARQLGLTASDSARFARMRFHYTHGWSFVRLQCNQSVTIYMKYMKCQKKKQWNCCFARLSLLSNHKIVLCRTRKLGCDRESRVNTLHSQPQCMDRYSLPFKWNLSLLNKFVHLRIIKHTSCPDELQLTIFSIATQRKSSARETTTVQRVEENGNEAIYGNYLKFHFVSWARMMMMIRRRETERFKFCRQTRCILMCSVNGIMTNIWQWRALLALENRRKKTSNKEKIRNTWIWTTLDGAQLSSALDFDSFFLSFARFVSFQLQLQPSSSSLLTHSFSNRQPTNERAPNDEPNDLNARN